MDGPAHPPEPQVIGPQQTIAPHPPTPTAPPAPVASQAPAPTSKPKKTKLILLVSGVALLLIVSSGVAWTLLHKEDKPSSSTSTATQPQEEQEEAASSDGCAYVPKKNYAQNEPMYEKWREEARKVVFDVYLPCSFPPDYFIRQLGVGAGDDNEVRSVFLSFNSNDPDAEAMGIDETIFHVRAIPPEHKPPQACIERSTVVEVETSPCKKVADSKHGPVYMNKDGDLYVTIGSGLVIWSYPIYDPVKDTESVLKVINSLQKVDPTKLEFFNS